MGAEGVFSLFAHPKILMQKEMLFFFEIWRTRLTTV